MIYTIGHSNHSMERLTQLLHQHGVTTLADVRSTPVSRFNPQFNRESLRASLADAAIQYRFMGAELGARASDPGCYEGHRVSYVKLARTAAFRDGIQRLLSAMREGRLAILCAEREPLQCHRTILLARELQRAAVPVAHIIHDGSLESHEAAMVRLVHKLKLPAPDLLRSSADLVEEAYEIQGAKIAYQKA